MRMRGAAGAGACGPVSADETSEPNTNDGRGVDGFGHPSIARTTRRYGQAAWPPRHVQPAPGNLKRHGACNHAAGSRIRSAVTDLLVHCDHSNCRKDGLANDTTSSRFLALACCCRFWVRIRSTSVARPDQAEVPVTTSTPTIWRGAGAQHSGEEAAVARAQHVGADDRLVGVDEATQQGAAQLGEGFAAADEGALGRGRPTSCSRKSSSFSSVPMDSGREATSILMRGAGATTGGASTRAPAGAARAAGGAGARGSRGRCAQTSEKMTRIRRNIAVRPRQVFRTTRPPMAMATA